VGQRIIPVYQTTSSWIFEERRIILLLCAEKRFNSKIDLIFAKRDENDKLGRPASDLNKKPAFAASLLCAEGGT
jgi:hypothetical protein